MIPMIDLMMVTVAFLLITAVWTHLSRVEAKAHVQGPSDAPPCVGDCPPERELHVEMRDPARFVLVWRQGAEELGRTEVSRDEKTTRAGSAKVVRYPALADAVSAEWRARGAHRDPTDHRKDRAVLHTDDATPYASIVGAMDAIHDVTRPERFAGKTQDTSALDVTFAVK